MGAGWDEYAVRWAAAHGGYDPRSASPLVRGWLRLAFHLAQGLAAVRLGPTPVTLAGLVVGCLVPVLVLPGQAGPLGAAALIVVGALADTVDGALARLTDRATRLGQVADGVADRITEAAWLVGLWLVGAPGWLVAGCGAVAWLHEYVRARATAAGMHGLGVVTVAERPTRVLLAALGLAVAGVTGLILPELRAGSATVAGAVWLVLGALGLLQLGESVRRALSGRPDQRADDAGRQQHHR